MAYERSVNRANRLQNGCEGSVKFPCAFQFMFLLMWPKQLVPPPVDNLLIRRIKIATSTLNRSRTRLLSNPTTVGRVCGRPLWGQLVGIGHAS